MNALALAALLLPAPLLAAPDDPGEGAQRLIMGALRIARRDWSPDACNAAVELSVDITPGNHYTLKEFKFLFWSPDKPNLQQLSWHEYYGKPKASEEYELPPNEYVGFKPASVTPATDGSCVTDMTIDSGKALGLAVRAGLAERSRYRLKLFLVTEQRPEWKTRSMRGRSVWEVRDNRRAVYVDATNGKVHKIKDVPPLRKGE